ncbi:hypothetical protein AB1N83_009927 [Pleurotus pulmonarius]
MCVGDALSVRDEAHVVQERVRDVLTDHYEALHATQRAAFLGPSKLQQSPRTRLKKPNLANEQTPCYHRTIILSPNSVPEGWPSYDPSQLTAVEDMDVTFVACPDWSREEQHHRAIIRYSPRARTPPLPSSASNGKRKHNYESSGNQSPRPVSKKVKIDEGIQRHSVIEDESDDNVGGEEDSNTSPRRLPRAWRENKPNNRGLLYSSLYFVMYFQVKLSMF